MLELCIFSAPLGFHFLSSVSGLTVNNHLMLDVDNCDLNFRHRVLALPRVPQSYQLCIVRGLTLVFFLKKKESPFLGNSTIKPEKYPSIVLVILSTTDGSTCRDK